ncbi:hypothetical protein PT110_05385 [Erysipelothrix rhusiopathiae]|nr:hypothetical protein [Erysipelothrix rhusiopathiae]
MSSSFDQFNGLVDDVDLSSRKLGFVNQQRNIAITEVMEQLNDIDVLKHNGDVIGDVYEYLISQFASDAGKRRENSILRMKYWS